MFGDGHDEGDIGFDGFKDGGGGVWRWNENGGGVWFGGKRGDGCAERGENGEIREGRVRMRTGRVNGRADTSYELRTIGYGGESIRGGLYERVRSIS